MKLTKKQELEARKLYEKYWDSYMKGDLKGFSSTLDEAFEMIGTSENEVCHNKTDGIKFYKAQMKEMAGKAEMRNRSISVKPVNGMFLFNETADIYILDKRKWTFYAGIRLSTLLHETKSGWKVIQQHGSFPDMRVQEGETIAFEKISKENLELRDAVKRATVELETKNRNLKTEAALERVRAVAMGMKKSGDLLSVCKRGFRELKKLGFADLRNMIIHTYVDEQKYFNDYDYSDALGGVVAKVPYTGNPVIEKFIRTIRKGKSAFSEIKITGKQLEDWKKFRKANKEPVDPRLNKAKALYYYIYSVGSGSIGISTFSPIDDEKRDILIRFRNVFDLSYQRYLDIQKAEAQAREAQIQLALERVRARTMGMHHSDELTDVVKLLYQEFDKLKLSNESTDIEIGLINEETGMADVWAHLYLSDGTISTFNFPLGHFEGTIHEIKKWKATPVERRNELFFTSVFSGRLWKKFSGWIHKFPELAEAFQPMFDAKITQWVTHNAYFSHGLLTLQGNEPYSQETQEIQKRFAKVFEQTYTRFLDLKKAEAQAREAQIEYALERVRSRTMAMQRSEELPEAANTLFLQVQALGIPAWSCGYNILSADKTSSRCIMSSEGEIQIPFTLPLTEHESFLPWYEAVKNDEEFFVNQQAGSELAEHYRYMKTLPELKPVFEQFDNAGISLPTFQINHLAKFKEGFLLFITYEPVPEAHDIFKRFAKVFEQTYTRFLDLQKAEAQAREAHIEAALERVRSRSMAMHKSEELSDLSLELVKQVQALGVATWFCAFNIYNDDPQGSLEWGSNGQGVFPRYRTPREGVFLRYYEAGQRDETLLINEIGEDECPAHYEYLCSLPGVGDQLLAMKKAGIPFPSYQIDHVAFFRYGYILFITYEPVPETHDIFKRFARVFEQTYTRFLDLQKAEAQAREAQIEAALEKVRSSSLAMHKSDEIEEVLHTVFEKLKELGIDFYTAIIILFTKDSKDIVWWLESKAKRLYPKMLVPYADIEYMRNLFEAREKGIEMFSKCYLDEEKMELFRHLFEHTGFANVPEEQKKFLWESEFATISVALANNTAIHITSYSRKFFSDQDNDVLKRFAKVFEQAYTRFLDLQKAEEQAREAQIEAALERIRSKVTAMQESSELLDIVVSMRREFVALSHGAGYFWYMRWLPDKYEKAMTSGDGSRIGMVMTLPRHIHGDIKLVADWEKSDEPALVFPMDVDTAVDYVDKMITLGDFQQVDPQAPTLDDIRHIGGLTFIMARTTHGEIGYSLTGAVPNPPEEDINILVRFAAVFDLAYRRFEDLKEAERRNRETQIELALERVRSRTMAMHKSAELKEVIKVVLEQFVHLNINVGHAGFYIDYKVHDDMHIWLADPNIEPFYVTLPYFDTPTWHSFLEAKRNGTALHTDLLNFEEKNNFYNSLFKLFTVPDEAKKFYLECKGLAVSTALLDNVGLYIENFDAVPYSEEENNILMRFAKVFQQTYTRFLDLQKAEIQAREAQIEAALEKVRSRSLAMQQPNELTEVAELLRKEMGQLGVEELETSSIYIVDKENVQAECWYAIKDIREESKNLVSDEMTIRFTDTWVGNEMGRFYRGKKEHISIVMKGDNRKEWINYCAGKSKVLQGYYGDEVPERTYHLVKFNGGYMGAASPGDISAESWDLLRRTASVFSLAYTRFNDLKIAEAHALQAEKDLIAIKEAKQKAEQALGELQATQKQLIQSEKMASLGELTAGIAHEIQNPLNFVNNFSEVSKELLDEMKVAIEKGDAVEAKEIMNDVIQNLEKINHHGKRADGIVKGMLQHSRSSSGQKEPTDINALCDEYLRLAFHGLRAKDKSFNATMETDFDESIGNINVVPQDIGRVILNLITNAFYAVNEKKASAGSVGQRYEPTVTVNTKKINDQVEISVKDNGNGISQKILDKIFQPFFTTKPTGQGTGLGLSLSYDIIKAHGGELRVKTKESEGSEFIISLSV